MKMWAYYDRKKAAYHHIYRSENIVRICSPDGFESKENSGEGEVVQVEISHLTTVAPDTKLERENCRAVLNMAFHTCPKCGHECRLLFPLPEALKMQFR